MNFIKINKNFEISEGATFELSSGYFCKITSTGTLRAMAANSTAMAAKDGAKSEAMASGAEAWATEDGAEAWAMVPGSYALAAHEGAKAYAHEGAKDYAYEPTETYEPTES